MRDGPGRPPVHGASWPKKTPEYAAWSSIKHRCGNPSAQQYHRYGGRGIAICKEWADDFAAFLAYVGQRPSPEMSIDRYPNKDGNYEPGNVRWATAKEQYDNRNAFIGSPVIRGDGVRFSCPAEGAKSVGLGKSGLYGVLNGKKQTAGGYTWRYADE